MAKLSAVVNSLHHNIRPQFTSRNEPLAINPITFDDRKKGHVAMNGANEDKSSSAISDNPPHLSMKMMTKLYC